MSGLTPAPALKVFSPSRLNRSWILLAAYLSDRPCEFTICQFERATLRASSGANVFVVPDAASLQKPDSSLRRGNYASLVRFAADPDQWQSSVQKNELLTHLFSTGLIAMFSPGLPQLWHEPSSNELDLWDALDSPTQVSSLLSHGHSLETLERMLGQGAIEIC